MPIRVKMHCRFKPGAANDWLKSFSPSSEQHICSQQPRVLIAEWQPAERSAKSSLPTFMSDAESRVIALEGMRTAGRTLLSLTY